MRSRGGRVENDGRVVVRWVNVSLLAKRKTSMSKYVPVPAPRVRALTLARVLEYVEITKNQENHEGQTMKNISRFYRLRNDDATTRHAATTARLSVVVLHYLLCILY